LLPGRFDFDGDVLAVTLPLDLANAPSLLKNRSLHLSTRRQCEQALHEVKQNPDFQDSKGMTALHYMLKKAVTNSTLKLSGITRPVLTSQVRMVER
jgi:hypothetical protein